MSKPRATISEIMALLKDANGMGADIRIPSPDDRPLIILEYNASKTPNPQTYRFYSLKNAKKWLTEVCAKLNAQHKEKEQKD